MSVLILHGDVLAALAELPDDHVHEVLTSPPYYGLRSYGIATSIWGGDPHCKHRFGGDGRRRRGGPPGKSAVNDGRDRSAHADTAVVNTGAFCSRCHAWRGHFGLEPDFKLYLKHMVLIMRETRRVLRPEGTCWLNLGDTYATGAGGSRLSDIERDRDELARQMGKHAPAGDNVPRLQPNRMPQPGLKAKDLMLIPERVAIALQEDGWWVRSRIPWLKRNAMPESAPDRPATATEYVWLLTKSEDAFYDREAVRLLSSENKPKRVAGWATGAGDHSVLAHTAEVKDGGTKLLRKPPMKAEGRQEQGLRTSEGMGGHAGWRDDDTRPELRNRRNSDWFFESWQGLLQDEDGEPLALIVNPAGFKGAHFATFSIKFVEPMILAGTSAKGCCPTCFAPWKRVTEKGDALEEWKRRSGANKAGEYRGVSAKSEAIAGPDAAGNAVGNGAQDPSKVKTSILNGMREVMTIGWYPTCDCCELAPLPRYPRRPSPKERPELEAELEAWKRECDHVAKVRRTLCALAARWTMALKPCRVLDLFGGSGTTAVVCERHGRDTVLIEIGGQYVEMQRQRLTAEAPLLADIEVKRV